MIGGGALAIEVATYIDDINIKLRTQGKLDCLIAVTDVVSSMPSREEDLNRIFGQAPKYHIDINLVDSIDQKRFVICIGDPRARWRIGTELKEKGFRLRTIVHPTAYIAKTAQVDEGGVVCPYAFVGPFARVGKNAVLNVSSVVGHDAVVGRAAVLSPGARMNGNTRCGEAAFLGAGATLTPKTELGNFAMLSAGSVLTKCAGDGFLMHGNPATGRQMIKIPVAHCSGQTRER